jgi:hypothetical protein
MARHGYMGNAVIEEGNRFNGLIANKMTINEVGFERII